MIKDIQIRVSLKESNRENILQQKAAKILRIDEKEINAIKILRKSVDARKPTVFLNYKVAVFTQEHFPKEKAFSFEYKDVSKSKKIHIIGFGPAGMFAALRCLELGFKPVVFERGKKVSDRRKDIKAINQLHLVDSNSNYCFGEGGAGTYSDGKLYTRSLKRGDVRKIFEVLVQHGASEDILIESHPHIGTNKLPRVVKNIRETILNYGGEIHFESKVVDINIEDNKVKSLVLENGQEFEADSIILSTGHSARDIYYLLDKKGVKIESKSFAMGVRVEHPQQIIDSIQYHCSTERDELLPAASYSLVQQINGRGVYSFCMCPGGFIVPAATSPGEVVVNGMSPSSRNSRFANSGIVVEIDSRRDLNKYEKYGVFKGLEFQKDLENLAWLAGGKTQAAPAQRLTDFVEGKMSSSLNETSYQPGLKSAPLHSLLPKIIGRRLRKGLKEFGNKMHGFYTSEASVIGVESRTSSPIKIPRNDLFEHIEITGLYPCGEGAGYAGGIVSAAMDGERCVDAISNK